ncbi:TetR/AcrR family transcriptional regulator [Nocardia vinacea]|uniref:TetR/AcrR family transcriptional regulator n=1 Tax=Nocardia vinacea TaxID=96468 RepID=UPI0002F40D18|nr:TetR/AcrR family transcriptional regulator [Nocardia vinacea]
MAEQTGGGRAAERTAAILGATLEILGEVGYDRLTTEAVAARAGASKMTLYRRWADKPSLVIAALRARSAAHPELASDARDLRSDLIRLVELFDTIAEAESSVAFAGLLVVAQREPDIAAVVRGDALLRRRTDCRDVVQRAIGRGEITDAALDRLLFETLIGRHMVKGLLVEDISFAGDAVGYVDRVLLPLLTSR